MAVPGKDSVRIVPLGGLGEIGLNLMVIECGHHAIVIDAGVMFSEDRALGLGILLPDLRHLAVRGLRVEALFLTHAHEDHLGALSYFLRKFPAPVYATAVTLAFARRTLREDGPTGYDLREMVPNRVIEAGPFAVEAVRVTHSTPDSIALAIRTPAGLIVHSGDFKIDPEPVDGLRFDTQRFAQLGEEGVELLLSDSTNVEREGRAGSESSLKPVINDLVRRTRGRFFLSSFSSHLHRIRQFAEVAHEAGRFVVPLGRRMSESVRLGMEVGQLNLPSGVFIDTAEADFLEPRRLAFLASGSQGEPLSALTKLASDSHPTVRIEQGDVVMLSSRFIPGNERAIHSVVNELFKRGAEVLYDGVAPVHVSGHACREELAELIRLVQPRHFVPIHGEYRHLAHHVRLAVDAGVAEECCFLLEDGDTLVLSGGEARRGGAVRSGRLVLEGEEFGGAGLIRERRTLAHDGAVLVIVAISARTGQIVAGPDLISRGVVEGDGVSPYLAGARAELMGRLQGLNGGGGARHPAAIRLDPTRLREEMTRALKRYFSSTAGKRPLIVPHVMEV
jgi:ribonuclease J